MTEFIEWQCRYSTTKEQREQIAFLERMEADGKLTVVPPAIAGRPSLGQADRVALQVWLDARRGAAEGFGGASLSWAEIDAWLRLRRFGPDDESALEIVLACEDAAKRGRALAHDDREAAKDG